MDQIKNFVRDEAAVLLSNRAAFHAIPEPSYGERMTMELVARELDQLGIPYEECGPTGIVATIGDKDAPTVGARFNMDGLEGCADHTAHPGVSTVENCAHACGHDVELAWAISIARYFAKYPPKGAIRLVFQPAEEGPGDDPQGRDGGKLMSESGAFDGLEALFSFHVDPDLPTGAVCVREGVATVGALDFSVTITGRASHLSRPQEGLNPIWEMSRFLSRFDESRRKMFETVQSDEYLRIDLSQVGSGLSCEHPFAAEINTLPARAELRGSVRCLGHLMDQAFHTLMRDITREAEQEARQRGEDFVYAHTVQECAVPTTNDPTVVAVARAAALTSDFTVSNQVKYWKDAAGWTSQRARVCHGYVGCSAEAGRLHTSTFYPPADVLPIGLELFLRCLSA